MYIWLLVLDYDLPTVIFRRDPFHLNGHHKYLQSLVLFVSIVAHKWNETGVLCSNLYARFYL